MFSLREGYQSKRMGGAGKGLATGPKRKGLNSGAGLAGRPDPKADKITSARGLIPEPKQSNGSARRPTPGGTGASSGSGDGGLAADELRRAIRRQEELSGRVQELSDELHKMKAIVLKHEVRIRDLEKINSNEDDDDDEDD